MAAQIIDGKTISANIEASVKTQAEELKKIIGRPPCLAVVLIGDDPASKVYVKRKQQACAVSNQ